MKGKTEVTLTPDDVRTAIKEYLTRHGMEPVGEIALLVGMECQGYGTAETNVPAFGGARAEVKLGLARKEGADKDCG